MKTIIASLIAATVLSLSIDVSAKTTCKKTTTFETDSNGNTIIKTHTVCEVSK